MDKFLIRKRKSEDVDDNSKTSHSKERKIEIDTDDERSVKPLVNKDIKWTEIRRENLVCDYCLLFNRKAADELLEKCEKYLIYNTGDLSKVKIFGKWHDIPRKQVRKF